MQKIYQDKSAEDFDLKLAIECAEAFSSSSGLGCTVSDCSGGLLYHTGYSCESCAVCRLAGKNREGCIQAHIYGMTEAERFGGKYIYFCPMGLICFVSPILGHRGSAAKITVGPFLMVDKEDYIAFDIEERGGLSEKVKEAIIRELEQIPYRSTKHVNALSILLFMAVGFMNNVSAAGRMLDIQSSDAIQGQISTYIAQLKGGEMLPSYPIMTEQKLLRSIADCNKPESQKLLNELLGHIFFSSGGNYNTIKSSVYELLVLISRAAIAGGAESEYTLKLSRGYLSEMGTISNIDELCMWLTNVMNRFIDSVFPVGQIKHIDVIHKAVQHMREHIGDKVTMEETAGKVYLSPSYFSKIFKEEMGSCFSAYLNRMRVEKSKTLLLTENLRLADIAVMVGFEDQSYFTKVFKKVTGVSPNVFRESKGRVPEGSSEGRYSKTPHSKGDYKSRGVVV